MEKIKKLNKLQYALLAILLLIIVLSLGLYIKYNSSNSQPAPKETPELINFNPPTEAEKKYAEDNKLRLDQEQNQANKQPPDNQSTGNGLGSNGVKPVINFVEQNRDNVEVGSFVPSIFEDGGTCTLELLGKTKVIKQVSAVKEGSSTYCPTFKVNTSELGSGTWKVTVSYQSATSSGVSDSSEVTIN